MDITDTSKQRRETAINLFCERKSSFIYNGVSFRIETFQSRSALIVGSTTDWYPENTTPEMAKEKIEKSKLVLGELILNIPEVANCINDLPRVYRCFTGDERGDYIIAEEDNGLFKWFL
jgi:hypothetical protein